MCPALFYEYIGYVEKGHHVVRDERGRYWAVMTVKLPTGDREGQYRERWMPVYGPAKRAEDLIWK
jgi:hypothetical protein